MLRYDYTHNYVYAGGCRYLNTPKVLHAAAREWHTCAWSVIKSGQGDTDWAYRLMGAQAARYRRNVARALRREAEK